MPTAEDVAAMHFSEDKKPLEFGKLIRAVYEETGVSQRELERASGVSAGALSHYERLLRLPIAAQRSLAQGGISFKIARAFTNQRMLVRDNLLDYMAPFLSKTLGSDAVEKYVGIAVKKPWLTPDEVRGELKGKPTPERPAPAYRTAPPMERPTAEQVRETAFKLSGLLLNWEPDGSVETLLAQSALKRLKGVLE